MSGPPSESERLADRCAPSFLAGNWRLHFPDWELGGGRVRARGGCQPGEGGGDGMWPRACIQASFPSPSGPNLAVRPPAVPAVQQVQIRGSLWGGWIHPWGKGVNMPFPSGGSFRALIWGRPTGLALAVQLRIVRSLSLRGIDAPLMDRQVAVSTPPRAYLPSPAHRSQSCHCPLPSGWNAKKEMSSSLLPPVPV